MIYKDEAKRVVHFQNVQYSSTSLTFRAPSLCIVTEKQEVYRGRGSFGPDSKSHTCINRNETKTSICQKKYKSNPRIHNIERAEIPAILATLQNPACSCFTEIYEIPHDACITTERTRRTHFFSSRSIVFPPKLRQSSSETRFPNNSEISKH